MAGVLENKGVLVTLLERFERHRLPRVIDIKRLVDQGGTLNDYDIDFLEEVLKETREYASFVEGHAEYRELFARAVHLYNEITAKALENERHTAGG